MNITRENIDDLNAILKIEIGKPDYEDNIETVLKEYRRRTNLKGFRPGTAPMGIVRKMFGKTVMAEEINKLISESIQKYIVDEKLELIGGPLQRTNENEEYDFDNTENFTFTFDLGIAPVFEIKLSKKNKLNSYDITIDEKMKDDHITNYKRRFGEIQQVDAIEEKDVIRGKIEAIDSNGTPAPGGPAVEETAIGADLIKDDAIKQMFIGKKINDTIDFDLKKAFPNENEIAGILGIKKEEVETAGEAFRFTVNAISRFKPAEAGQELYDKIYGEGEVTTEEEFMKEIEEELALGLKRDSGYKLNLDAKKLVIDKTPIDLPEEFLKKWLLKATENSTMEQIEADFESFKNDMKWQLIKNKIVVDNNIDVSSEEMYNEAVRITMMQLYQYGLYHFTQEQISDFAKESLKREDDVKKIGDRIIEGKVIENIKSLVKIENKSITIDAFNKLFAVN
ncbi:MAG: trigger factor [Bacteroidales bacterium]|jgi:trigger factor|nr:trigger factor [Bacteroidales bacterium]